MTDWFRTWHGAPSDPKWRLIAKRASVRPGDVWAVVSYLFDRASQAEDRGSVAGYDAELIAEVFGYEHDEVTRIIVELEAKAVIVAGRLAAWDKYQPKREDGSAERAKAYRERMKEETERTRTQANAVERPEESRIETEEKGSPRARKPNPIVILQSEVDAVTAQRWAGHCEDKGKRLSVPQAEQQCVALREIRAAGGNPAEAIRFAIDRGWVSLQLEYFRNNGFPLKPTTAAPALASWPVDKWRPILAYARERREWNREIYGPAPFEPGCVVPSDLLLEQDHQFARAAA